MFCLGGLLETVLPEGSSALSSHRDSGGLRASVGVLSGVLGWAGCPESP